MRWLDGTELDISDMTKEDFAEKLSLSLFDYDYSDWALLPEWAQNAAYIIAFDTELNMEGIFTFLENGIGHYAPEIIRAFRAIGDEQDADALAEICRIAPPDVMRGELAAKDYQQYDLTCFNDDHELTDEASERIEELESALYLNADFDMCELFYVYLESQMKS